MSETKDVNGNELLDGDSVQLTKDLNVKGASMKLKRGDVIKNIKLGSDPELIECRVGKKSIYLKTCFLKKR